MTVTVFQPDQLPEEIECVGEFPLADAQKIVGGYVECIYSRDLEDGRPAMIMILNEEGKLEGLPRNILANDIAHALFHIAKSDFIVGPAIILSGDNRWT